MHFHMCENELLQVTKNYLIEADGIETETEIKEANTSSIEKPKEDICLCINWLWFKKMELFCHMEGEKCDQEMPARQCRGW
jgi:hypothetical protein